MLLPPAESVVPSIFLARKKRKAFSAYKFQGSAVKSADILLQAKDNLTFMESRDTPCRVTLSQNLKLSDEF